MSSLDYLDLCRLCLVKDRVSVPIFEGEGDVRQIFLKIAACLPVKVAREDKLPKKICDDCTYKVELLYQFWNTTANAEKQLLQWLGEVGIDGKQGYVTNTLNQNVMKQEQSTENRLDGGVLQQVNDHQNNMNMGMMDNMGLGIPMMISSANQQQITSVPMDTSGNSVQTVQAVPGPSSQTTHNQISQNQTSSTTQQEEEEESSEEDENSDEECDGDEGLPVKEESEEDPSSRTIEPTTFVNVSLACDEAGPSGLQQQKISDMSEIPMQQSADGDPKSGRKPVSILRRKVSAPKATYYHLVVLGENESTGIIHRIPSVNVKIMHRPNNPQERPSPPVPHQIVEQPRENGAKPSETRAEVDTVTKESSTATQSDEVEVDRALEEVRTTCPFCEKRFASVNKMENHVNCVHKLPYQCDQCSKAFHTQQALDEHKVIHQPDYFFECDICRVKYKSEASMKRHQIRVHSDQKSIYICEHCGRCYKLKVDLTQHIKRSHNSQYQICRFCGKVVRNIKSHEWRHQTLCREDARQHTCNYCGKKFCHRSRLDKHLRIHEKGGFKCQDCGKECRGSRALSSHRQYSHGRGKISTCIVCQKTFTSASNYHQHVLTHAGIRPYKCDICEEDFTQRSSVLRHRKQHKGPLPPVNLVQPQVADLARSYLQKLQNDQIDKSCVLNTKL